MIEVICTGLVVTDYILDGICEPIGPLVGGTAANVACALAGLGYAPALAVRLGNDPRGRFLKQRLTDFGVCTSAVRLDSSIETPFCIEVLYRTDGAYMGHTFRTSTLDGEIRSPRYAGLGFDLMDVFNSAHSKNSIIFCSKQDESVLDFIKRKECNVYYEPNVIDNILLHTELCKYADIIKMNHGLFSDYDVDTAVICGSIIIETLGSEGVLVRFPTNGTWRHAVDVRDTSIVDATGAGDWFSAGFISSWFNIMKSNKKGELQHDQLVASIERGLRAARLSCEYRGALGALSLSHDEISKRLSEDATIRWDEFEKEDNLAKLINGRR